MKKYTRLLARLTAAGLGLSTVISASAAVRCGQALQFFDEQTQSDQTQAKLLSQSIEEMLSAGNYTDGEAIAVVRGSSGPAISGDAEMLLSLGSDSIRGAIDTEKKNGSPAADLAGRRMKEEGTPFSVWKVSDSGKTTKELLEELYADPDVISAEPNYMAYAAEEKGTENAETKPPQEVPALADLSEMQWDLADTSSLYTTPLSPTGGYSLGVPGWKEGRRNVNAPANSSGTICIMDGGRQNTDAVNMAIMPAVTGGRCRSRRRWILTAAMWLA